MKPYVLFVLLPLCNVAFADTFPSAAAAKSFTDQVMAKIAAGDMIGGVTMIKKYTVVPPAEFDAMVGQVSLQLPAIAQRFGKSVGIEFLHDDKVGDSLEELVYLQKMERTAMRWRFYLYKGVSGWNINSFKFDDQITDLFAH